MKKNIIEHQKALSFIFAGNSIFTALNTKSNNRFTFKVKKHKEENIYFVSVLTSPDVYQFIGSVKENNYKHSNKSKISSKSQSVEVFNYILSKLKTESLPKIVEIWHNGRCGRCCRLLTVPSSISSGFGPECMKLV
jgi:hypothetical protein